MRRIAIRLIAGAIAGIVLYAAWQAAVLLESKMGAVTPLFYEVHAVASIVGSIGLAVAIAVLFDPD